MFSQHYGEFVIVRFEGINKDLPSTYNPKLEKDRYGHYHVRFKVGGDGSTVQPITVKDYRNQVLVAFLFYYHDYLNRLGVTAERAEDQQKQQARNYAFSKVYCDSQGSAQAPSWAYTKGGNILILEESIVPSPSRWLTVLEGDSFEYYGRFLATIHPYRSKCTLVVNDNWHIGIVDVTDMGGNKRFLLGHSVRTVDPTDELEDNWQVILDQETPDWVLSSGILRELMGVGEPYNPVLMSVTSC